MQAEALARAVIAMRDALRQAHGRVARSDAAAACLLPFAAAAVEIRAQMAQVLAAELIARRHGDVGAPRLLIGAAERLGRFHAELANSAAGASIVMALNCHGPTRTEMRASADAARGAAAITTMDIADFYRRAAAARGGGAGPGPTTPGPGSGGPGPARARSGPGRTLHSPRSPDWSPNSAPPPGMGGLPSAASSGDSSAGDAEEPAPAGGSAGDSDELDELGTVEDCAEALSFVNDRISGLEDRLGILADHLLVVEGESIQGRDLLTDTVFRVADLERAAAPPRRRARRVTRGARGARGISRR